MICSDERKAIETAAALGRDFTQDERVREVERPWVDDPDEFKVLVRRYLAGEPIAGWEPQDQALARFSQAARGIVVSHGTIMSLFVASAAGIDPVQFWLTLRMPDAWQIEGGRLLRLETSDLL